MVYKPCKAEDIPLEIGTGEQWMWLYDSSCFIFTTIPSCSFIFHFKHLKSCWGVCCPYNFSWCATCCMNWLIPYIRTEYRSPKSFIGDKMYTSFLFSQWRVLMILPFLSLVHLRKTSDGVLHLWISFTCHNLRRPNVSSPSTYNSKTLSGISCLLARFQYSHTYNWSYHLLIR